MPAQSAVDVASGSAEAASPPEAARTSTGRPGVPWRGALVTVSLSVYPFATFLETNRHEGIQAGQVAFYALVVALAGIVILGAVWAVGGARRADRVAVTLGAGWVLTVNYQSIADPIASLDLGRRYQLAAWGVLALAVAAVAWRGSQRPAVRVWFLLFAALVTLIPLVQFVQHRLSVSDAPPAAAMASAAGLERTPDIYYVMPDAYDRADVLEEIFGFDNSAFLDLLEERGFVIAENAYANYSRTFLSVAAVLQMDYPAESGPDALTLADDDRVDRAAFYAAIRGESTVAETLREAGYRYVQAPAGTWGGSDCSGAEDLCVEPISESGAGVVLGEVEWALLQMTPAGSVLEGLGHTFDDAASDPVHSVQEINRQGWGDPVFAFIHMMHPHPPFPFDADCRPADTEGRDLLSWPEGSEPAYIEAVQCTNRRLEAMLDVLPRDAIVVIQSDHGTSYRGQDWYPEERWGPKHIQERFGILSAIRLPEDCRDMVDDRLAGVNTFRVVLACLSGEEPELLPYRHMYNEPIHDPEMREVEIPAEG
jgi:hypothetical protein